MNKRNIAIFDIDYTLFNTKNYRLEIFRKIGEYLKFDNLDDFEKLADQIYMELRESIIYFDPNLYAKALGNHLNIKVSSKAVEKITFNQDVLNKHIYEEVYSALEKLNKNNFKIGLFSTGLKNIQLAKINKLKHLLEEEHIHVFLDKKEHLPDIIKKYKNDNLWIIDDVLSLLETTKMLNKNVKTVWIKRGRFALNEKELGFKADFVTDNLNEAASFILGLKN